MKLDLPTDRLTVPTPESMVEEIRTLDLGRLEERIAVFRRIPAGPDGGPGARLADCDELITELRAYLERYRRRLALTEPMTLRRYLSVLTDAADSDIDAYPATRLALVLLKVETMILIGDAAGALAIVGPMAENLHSLEGGFGDIAGVYLLDATARLALGEVRPLSKVVFGRFLQTVNWRPWSARRLFALWYPALGVRPIWQTGTGVVEFLVLMCARWRLAARGGPRWRYDLRLIRLLVVGIANLIATVALLLFRRRGRVPNLQLNTAPIDGVRPRDVLVSRVVDDPGDIIMLLPGLKALSQKLRRPVWLATRPEFAPLLHDNPYVRLLDATQPLGMSGFRRWINLSICPARIYEERVRPVVRHGRMRIFARALGVGQFRLWRSGLVPEVRLSGSQQNMRDALRAGAPLVVGLNAVGRDSSRSAPWLEHATGMAPGARMLMLDTRTPCHQPLGEAIAAVAACDYLVAIDDWVLHLGAALGIPTLGIAGPSMTQRLLPHHPRLHLLEPPEWLPCRPCWRTESHPCALTGLRRSACLAAGAQQAVPSALRRLMEAYPKAGTTLLANTPDTAETRSNVPKAAAVFLRVLPGDAAVHPVMRAMRDALRYADLEAIAEKLEALRRTPPSISGYPAIRPADCRSIIQGLEAFLDANRTLFEAGSRELGERFLGLADQLADCGISAYPNEVLQLQLMRARALVALGREDEALAIVGPMAMRPYIIEGDMSSLAGALEVETQARLSLGQLGAVRRGAFLRILLIVRLQPWEFLRRFDHLASGLAVGRRLADAPNFVEPLFRLTARLRLRAIMLAWHKRIWRNKLRYIGARAGQFVVAPFARTLLLLISLNRNTRLLPGIASYGDEAENSLQAPSIAARIRAVLFDPRPVLVTRAMGGLGDIMMMTPGLAGLSRKTRQPVHFATRTAFFPALENNPTIRLVDVEQAVDPRHYRGWVNLSFCPAAEYESSVWPRVRKGRVQLFARRMGIGPRGLDQVTWLPRCHLSAEQEAIRDAARERFAATGLPAIAVAAYARELYRSYPAITETMLALADEAVLVMFHTYKVPIPSHPNIIPMMGGSLAASIATLAACDYYLGVDSAFFHIAVAFGLRCLGMFGPTSGKIRASSGRYPNVRLVPHAQHFACAPCWRNEDMACYVSGGQSSTCLTSTTPHALAEEMRRMMRDHPLDRTPVSKRTLIAAQ